MKLHSGVANEGFESVRDKLPEVWVLDSEVADKGSVTVLDAWPGANGRVLVLEPNEKNGGEKLLGVGQMLDAGIFVGRTVTVEMVAGATEGTAAVVGVHALGEGGDLGFVQLTQADSGGSLKRQVATLKVVPAARNIIVYAVSTGSSGKAVFDSIQVGLAPRVHPPTTSLATHQLTAASGRSAVDAEIVIDPSRSLRQVPATVFGTNVEWIFDGQGLWSARAGKLDADAVLLTKQLSPTLIRFPGGVFSDTYHWRNGLGPQSQRQVTAHYPGGPQSRNSFGIQELVEFSDAVGAQLLLTVNAGTGTAKEAADWVRYMKLSGGADVRYWEVGNELYMKGDLSGAFMTAEAYARRFASFASAMRAADPTIKLGAIGGLNYGNYSFIADAGWTRKVLARNAGQIDFLAIHDAYAPVVMAPSKSVAPRDVYLAMMAAPTQVEANLRAVSALLAAHETPGRPISIAVTEWGPFFHVLPSSPWVDHAKTMGSALFVASTMNTFLRTPRVKIANFFKLTESGFMGWLGRRKGKIVATAPAMAFELYRRKLGTNLVHLDSTGPTFNAGAVGVVGAAANVPMLDAVATFDDGKLVLIVVNRSDTQTIHASLRLAGVAEYEKAKVEGIYAASFDSNTGTTLPRIPGIEWAPQVSLGRFALGANSEIGRFEMELPAVRAGSGGDAQVGFDFRPLSITSITFEPIGLGDD
ncbi:MAG: hypothetical protein ACOH1R_10075 [Luteimonas sp.]